MGIHETTLEMHFHNPLMKLIQVTLGLGKGKFNFYKYSPQRECFVGFDQAFIHSDLSDEAMFERLRSSAAQGRYQLGSTFLGLFLQFKVVRQIARRSRHTPSTIGRTPHLRVSLDTKKNGNTGFSQHELLFSLKDNPAAFVYYACPMIFDKTDLYVDAPDLALLRLADVESCPSSYADNDSHFIYYDDPNAAPVWCSEPVEGHGAAPSELSRRIADAISEGVGSDALKLWQKLFAPEASMVDGRRARVLDYVHDSLTLLEIHADGKIG